MTPQNLLSFFNAQALADALRVNHTVTTVNLHYNKFGDEGLKARPPQRPRLSRRKRDFAQPLCAIVETCDRTFRASCEGLGFHDHVVLCVHFTWVLRADPSTQSAARPWPRPWRSMKPSQRSVSDSIRRSVMKDARRGAIRLCPCQSTFVIVRRVESSWFCGFRKFPPWDALKSANFFSDSDYISHSNHLRMPVVPHEAVAEVSRIGNLQQRLAAPPSPPSPPFFFFFFVFFVIIIIIIIIVTDLWDSARKEHRDHPPQLSPLLSSWLTDWLID